jgi:hypothetical protein
MAEATSEVSAGACRSTAPGPATGGLGWGHTGWTPTMPSSFGSGCGLRYKRFRSASAAQPKSCHVPGGYRRAPPCVQAGVRRPVSGRTSVRSDIAADTGMAADTSLATADISCPEGVVPEPPDGQSAGPSASYLLPQGRPPRCGTPPTPSSSQTIMAHGGGTAPIGSAAPGWYCAAA